MQCPAGKLILHLQCEHLNTFRATTLYWRNRFRFICIPSDTPTRHSFVRCNCMTAASIARQSEQFWNRKYHLSLTLCPISWHFVVNAFDAKFKRRLALRILQNEANEAWRDKRKTFNTPNRRRMPFSYLFQSLKWHFGCRVRVSCSVFRVPCCVSAIYAYILACFKEWRTSSGSNSAAFAISNAAVTQQIRQTVIQVEMHSKVRQQQPLDTHTHTHTPRTG